MTVAREALWADLTGIPDVCEAPSSFKDAVALWVHGTEVAHWDDDEIIDIRLTRAVIRQHRDAWRADSGIVLRRSSSADWLEVRVSDPADEAFVLELLRMALIAHGGGTAVE